MMMMMIFSSYKMPSMNFDLWKRRFLTKDEVTALLEESDDEHGSHLFFLLKVLKYQKRIQEIQKIYVT